MAPELSLKLCCGDRVIPLEPEIAALRDLYDLRGGDMDDQKFLLLKLSMTGNQFGWLQSLVGVQKAKNMRSNINKLKIMTEIHDAIEALRPSNNKRLKNPKLIVPIKVRNQVLLVRNNPNSKELAFRQSTEHLSAPMAEDIQLLQWFVEELEKDLESLVDEPLAPQPLAAPPAADQQLDEDVDLHLAVEAQQLVEAEAALEHAPKRPRCSSIISSENTDVAAGLQQLQHHENCKLVYWVPSRRSFRTVRTSDDKDLQFRVKKIQKLNTEADPDLESNEIKITIARAIEFLEGDDERVDS